MTWDVQYLPEAEKDLRSLAHSQQIIVMKAIKKVRENPLPQSEGGYGKPLGHLTGFLKIKLRSDGIRVVYKLIRTKTQMLVVVIGVREDEEVYDIAQLRKIKTWPLIPPQPAISVTGIFLPSIAGPLSLISTAVPTAIYWRKKQPSSKWDGQQHLFHLNCFLCLRFRKQLWDNHCFDFFWKVLHIS